MIRKRGVGFCLLFASLVLLAYPTATFAAKKAALIIGISQYADIEIPDLKYADADALELVKFLTTWGGLSRDCVIVLINDQATASRIRNAFRKMERTCPENDGSLGDVLIYYSGHAVAAGRQGLFAKRGIQAREFIAPHDAFLSETYKLRDGTEVNDTFLKKEWFANRLTSLDAKSVTVVIDACRSGMPDFESLITQYMGFRVTKLGNQALTKGLTVYMTSTEDVSKPKKRIVLLSATNEQNVAWEFDELQHGALSYAVLDSLWKTRNTAQPGSRKTLTVAELYESVTSTFANKRVRGRFLKDYHEPKIYMVPERIHNSIVFSEIQAMKPKVTTGRLVIRTTPRNAYIFIDGVKRRERTNAEVELPVGEHVVIVQEPGSTYRHVFEVDIRPNRTTTEVVDLTGTLRVQTRLKDSPGQPGPKVNIYLDGKFLANSSSVRLSNIAAGTHTLRVALEGVQKSKEISIRPDSPLLVKYTVVRVRRPEKPTPPSEQLDTIPF